MQTTQFKPHIITFVLMLIVVALLSLSGCSSDTATPTPIADSPQGKALAWQLWDPADPALPTILDKNSDNSYKLTSGWDASSITYSYGWWGLGNPGNDYQVIERTGAEYKNGDNTVSTTDIQALLVALDRLYPTQLLLTYSGHTDDYPDWTVELQGTDGQHILLLSDSNSNPGNGPWNVLYNGRLYAQYDGALGQAIGKLFGGTLAQRNSFSLDGSQGDVLFSTEGLPPQLIYGFWGLVPISKGFSYSVDFSGSAITGRITGESSIGSMQIGDIDKLLSVSLTPPDGAITTCTTEDLPEGDPFTPVTSWKFTCPVHIGNPTDRYDYGISVQFGREGGTTTEVKGELYGAWQSDQTQGLALPLPAELATDFAQNTNANDLLSDHQPAFVTYSGKAPLNDPMQGERTGEAVFLGQTKVLSQTVRYSIGTRFEISNTQMVYWTLDRTMLDGMLKKITSLPTTERVLQADPLLTLNMWYAGTKPPEMNAVPLYSGGPEEYNIKVNPCGSVPGAILPNDTQPLEAFGYNLSRNLYMADFVLIDGRPVVANLDLFPQTQDPARATLIPKEFDTGQSRPFDRVWMQGASLFEPYDKEGTLIPGGTELTLDIPQDASPSEKAVYTKLAQALPGMLNMGEAWWTVDGITFTPNADGSLGVVGCK